MAVLCDLDGVFDCRVILRNSVYDYIAVRLEISLHFDRSLAGRVILECAAVDLTC
jgi:hypothetical protein